MGLIDADDVMQSLGSQTKNDLLRSTFCLK